MVGYDDDLLDVMESVVVVSCKCYRCRSHQNYSFKFFVIFKIGH